MFYTFAELDPIDIYKLRKTTISFLTDDDNKKLRCASFRYRKSSTEYWTEKENEELEYQVLYRPEFLHHTPESDPEE